MNPQEQQIERLMKAASEFVGFEITADNYQKITAAQARGLLDHLKGDPDFQTLALMRGSPVAEASIWLNGRLSGADIPLDELARMAQGNGPKPGALVNKDEQSGVSAAQEGARAKLASLSQDPEWRAKALTRGTPEAREYLELNSLVSGGNLSGHQLDGMAAGLGPESSLE